MGGLEAGVRVGLDGGMNWAGGSVGGSGRGPFGMRMGVAWRARNLTFHSTRWHGKIEFNSRVDEGATLDSQSNQAHFTVVVFKTPLIHSDGASQIFHLTPLVGQSSPSISFAECAGG